MKEKVLIIFGGKSVENDISVITFLQVWKNLPSQYEFLPCYIDKLGKWWTADNLNDAKIYKNFEKLAKNKKEIALLPQNNTLFVRKKKKFVPYEQICCVLNCCHGGDGEGGNLQGLISICDIPQTSCLCPSSALCMDKIFSKYVLEKNEIPVAKYAVLKRGEKFDGQIDFPLIVKPACLGSSIGISVCHKKEEFDRAIDLAFEFDDKVLIEELICPLREFNCAVFRYKDEIYLSSVNEVLGKSEIFSFADKYLSKEQKSASPEKSLTEEIKALTKKVYEILDCDGVVRVDFLFDETSKKIYVNEVNTIPGSLAFYLFKDVCFKDLLISLIVEAQRKFSVRKRRVTKFESNAVEIYDSQKITKK